MKKSSIALLLFTLVSAGHVLAADQASNVDEPKDVVARVGGEPITFSQINTMINSSAIVGLSMPELGSPERDTVRLTLLDKLISANLLYLDAVKKGADKDPEYREALHRFQDSMLATLYRNQYLVGDLNVTDAEIDAFYKDRIVAGTEMTPELRAGIEATIRKQKVKEHTEGQRERLRKGHDISLVVTELDPEDDQVRDKDDVVARLDGENITWGETRPLLQRAHTMRSAKARIKALDTYIDTLLMTQLGRGAGLEDDPVFKARNEEFRKTRLINQHRRRLLSEWEPSDKEIEDYYNANRDRIVVKEVRKVQMLVVKTEAEAYALKKQIEDGKLTFHQAVAEHSIIPDAKRTLGQIGWVSEGTGFPELDKETFLVEAGEIGGPVKSPAGWHLMRVLDQRDAVHEDINDEGTRKVARRMLLEDKLNQYVIELRKQEYPVEINEDMIGKLSQQEIDWYQDMLHKARKSPEEVIEEIQRLRNK